MLNTYKDYDIYIYIYIYIYPLENRQKRNVCLIQSDMFKREHAV